jgi:hypothetical protein
MNGLAGNLEASKTNQPRGCFQTTVIGFVLTLILLMAMLIGHILFVRWKRVDDTPWVNPNSTLGIRINLIVNRDFQYFDQSGDSLVNLVEERNFEFRNEKKQRVEFWDIGNYLDRADAYGNRDGFASKEEAIAFLRQYDASNDGVIQIDAEGSEHVKLRQDSVLLANFLIK